MEQSLDYAMAAVAAGTSRIVATPHVERLDIFELPERVHELREALAHERIPLAVEVGGELKARSVFGMGQEQLEVIAHGPPGARWLLYEVPFRGVDDLFLEGARELTARGFGLLCAHPERSQGLLTGGLTTLEPVLDAGAVVAANVAPLGGEEGPPPPGRVRGGGGVVAPTVAPPAGGGGPEPPAAARPVLRRGRAGVLATDAPPPRRPFTLADGEYAVEALTGKPEVAAWLTTVAPARLLDDGIQPAARSAA